MPFFSLPRRGYAVALALALAIGLLAVCLYLPSAVHSAGVQVEARRPALIFSGPAQGLDPAEGEVGQTLFTFQDGLVADHVTALLRDDRSLWVGTPLGLCRYTLEGRQGGLTWRTFDESDGMAAEAVSALWDDDAGGLWVAHPTGALSFFDGVNWTRYENLTETLELAYDQIVETDAQGPLWSIEAGSRVWTLFGGTVGYYVGSVWRPYGQDAGIPPGRLIAVWAGQEGAWVAAENGRVGYFDGFEWTTYRDVFDAVQRQSELILASGPRVAPFWVVDAEDGIWVRNPLGTRPDVRRFAEARWTNFGAGDGMSDGFVAELRLDAYGRVWTRHVDPGDGGTGGGLSVYRREPAAPSALTAGTARWVAIPAPRDGDVTSFWPEGREGVWIGIGSAVGEAGVPVGGLAFVDLDVWRRFSWATLEGTAVNASWLDPNDHLGLGLAGDARVPGGLLRYRPAQDSRPAQWNRVEGLTGAVQDLWGDEQGRLWVATTTGVDRVNVENRRVVSYTRPGAVDDVAGDRAGNVWALAVGDLEAGGGLWQWNGQLWASHTVSDGQAGGARTQGGTYVDMAVLADGRVYLAGDRGLEIWDGEEWQRFAALPGRYVEQLWQDMAGDLWLSSVVTPGMPFNLSFYRDGLWQTVLNEDRSAEMGAQPLALWRDRRDQVWLGAAAGVFRYALGGDGLWHGLGAAEGVPRGSVTAIYEDQGGTIWIAVGEQLYRTDGQRWRRFEPQVGAVNHIAAGPAGGVSIAGTDGVALYDGRAPELRLEQVVNVISGARADGREPVVLTVGQDAVRIDLVAAAPTLSARQLYYRYRLQGIDDAWRIVPARALGGKEAAITYAGLPGGVYTFTAAAGNDVLDYGPDLRVTLYVLSRPPQLFVDRVAVAGRPVETPSQVQAYVAQPLQFRLSGDDDQLTPLTYRYQIQGLSDAWTETMQSEISFTLNSAGTFTFVATALDGEGQSSMPVGAQIVVREQEVVQRSGGFPLGVLVILLGGGAVLLLGGAAWLALRRRRRESW